MRFNKVYPVFGKIFGKQAPKCIISDELNNKILLRSVSKLEEEIATLKLNQSSIFDILKYTKLSDEEIYKEFQYQKWGELIPFTRKYLCERFKIDFLSSYGRCCNPEVIHARADECVGYTFDKFSILSKEQV